MALSLDGARLIVGSYAPGTLRDIGRERIASMKSQLEALRAARDQMYANLDLKDCDIRDAEARLKSAEQEYAAAFPADDEEDGH